LSAPAGLDLCHWSLALSVQMQLAPFVRNATAPRQHNLERKDEMVAVDVSDNLALVKLRLQMAPRYFRTCCHA